MSPTTPMINLPKQYKFLEQEKGPKMLLEMLKIHGTLEDQSNGDNPEILRWANEVGLGKIYKHDSIAWCGLAVSFAAMKAKWKYAPRGNALWARNWLAWENVVPYGEEMLGDVLVFKRGPSTGHVGLYVGEDKTHFHVLGGNQSDAVNIKRIEKIRLLSGRRPKWRVAQPINVRKIYLSASGAVSASEA